MIIAVLIGLLGGTLIGLILGGISSASAESRLREELKESLEDSIFNLQEDEHMDTLAHTGGGPTITAEREALERFRKKLGFIDAKEEA